MLFVNEESFSDMSSSERKTLAKLNKLPGVCMFNVTLSDGDRVREIDTIILTPGFAGTFEVKYMKTAEPVNVVANGPWLTESGAPVEFSTGTNINPLKQARRGAQIFKTNLLAKTSVSFYVNAFLVLDTKAEVAVQKEGGCTVTSLDHLFEALVSTRLNFIYQEDVQAVLSMLGYPTITSEELTREGFLKRSQKPPPSSSAKEAKKERHPVAVPLKTSKGGNSRSRRLSELQNTAYAQWKRSNFVLLTLSLIFAVPALISIFVTNPVSLGFGAILAFLVASIELFKKFRRSGQVKKGVVYALQWGLTLLPVVAAGAYVYDLMYNLSFGRYLEGYSLKVVFDIIMILLLLAVRTSGKSWYMYPEPLVMERYTADGRPTGAFMLVDVSPRKSRRADWKLLPETPHRDTDDSNWAPPVDS